MVKKPENNHICMFQTVNVKVHKSIKENPGLERNVLNKQILQFI